jgi:hypothetical protein
MVFMGKARVLGVLALGLVVGVAACDRSDGMDGQQTGAEDQMFMPQQDMDPEMMAQIMEIQQIQQELEPIQREALADPVLAAQLEALQARIEASMRAQGPEVYARIDRFQDEVAAAEAAGDQERMQVLMMEAQGIQQEAQALQAAVFEQPDIKTSVEEFEAAHRARMIAIDPAAEELLNRMEALMAGLAM